MKDGISISFRDEQHMRVHVDQFIVSLDTAVAWARSRLEASPRRNGGEHFDFKAPTVVGWTGLRTLRPWTRGDFWAPRRGRTLPSHLIEGRKSRTLWLCVWGIWQDKRHFILHTLYPGRVAPREIHDPELPLAELPEAVAFWARHAIVVSGDEWERPVTSPGTGPGA